MAARLHTHSNALIVIASTHGAHDVRRDNGHDQRRCGGSRRDPGALGRHEASQHGGQAAKPGGNKDADVVQRHAHSQAVQQVPHANRRELHAGVNGRADRSAKWIPRPMIKPLEELLNAILRGGKHENV